MKYSMLACMIAAASAAHGQAWVSASTGNDAYACTRTAPCATFQRAVNVTLGWGQVNVLDAGDYGPMVIKRAITIDGGGFAANFATSGAAVTVQAPSGQIVQLRNMAFHGNGSAATAISYLSGGQLHLDNINVSGFNQSCITANVTGPGNADLVIKDSSIDNCSTAGIYIQSVPSLTAEIINTHVKFSNYGLLVYSGRISVFGSTFSSPGAGNSGSGIVASNALGSPSIMLDNCEVSGFYWAINSYSAVQISRSAFNYNNVALMTEPGGSIISNGNNSFFSNGQDGYPTKTVGLQ